MEHALKTYRDANGVSLTELSRRAGIDKSHIWKIETGKVGRPSLETMKKLIGATNGSVHFRDFLPPEMREGVTPNG